MVFSEVFTIVDVISTILGAIMVRNMKMMKFAVLPVFVAALVGCQSTTVNNNSQFVVDDAVLTKYSTLVVVDDLEGLILRIRFLVRLIARFVSHIMLM